LISHPAIISAAGFFWESKTRLSKTLYILYRKDILK